jgi:Holliday junction DNA helicase RuvA
MYDYINGLVTDIEANYITVENNKIGYLIYVANPYAYTISTDYKVYIYEQVREDELTLYGFINKKERELFLQLINVKGLGCKMALPILASGNTDEVINAIENENITYLKKFPKIGDKVARQIILDLKGKLVSTNTDINNYEELKDTLKALGYKLSEIEKILPKITAKETKEQIKEALKLMIG